MLTLFCVWTKKPTTTAHASQGGQRQNKPIAIQDATLRLSHPSRTPALLQEQFEVINIRFVCMFLLLTNKLKNKWITYAERVRKQTSSPVCSLTNSTEYSPSWESRISSPNKLFGAFYGTTFTKICHLTLSQINSAHVIPSCIFKIHINIILPSTSRCSKCFL
jgi:hypothetical protein